VVQLLLLIFQKASKSFGGKKFFLIKDIVILKETKKLGKKTKSFGGKIFLD